MPSFVKALLATAVSCTLLVSATSVCDEGQIALGRLNGARGQPGLVYDFQCNELDEQTGDGVGPCGRANTYANGSDVLCDENGAPTDAFIPGVGHYNNCVTINDASCDASSTILACCTFSPK